MKKYVYIVRKDDTTKVNFFLNKKDALEEMKAITGGALAVWVDRLPRNKFNVLDPSYMQDIFDANSKEVEAVASINW
jgi:hypothetical protein